MIDVHKYATKSLIRGVKGPPLSGTDSNMISEKVLEITPAQANMKNPLFLRSIKGKTTEKHLEFPERYYIFRKTF
jgi:hypothetical protein